MSNMSLNEAIEHLNDVLSDDKEWECEQCRNEHAILREFLQEIQQYRSIGTVEECNIYKRIAETTFSTACLDMKIIDELHEYKNIGTVEECSEAVERQRGKKPVKYDNCGNKTVAERCQNCFEIVGGKYCENCGQRILLKESED